MSFEASDFETAKTEESGPGPGAASPENRKTDGDDPMEQEESVDPAGSPESQLSDPAILAIMDGPTIRYTPDELLKLRDSPLSQRKPDVKLDPLPHIFEQERSFDRRKSDTPTENGPRGEGQDHRRRPGDPRERIRKENDGIVLSPQRRSFNSGCFVPVRESNSRSNRSHSPLGKTDNSHTNAGRETNQQSNRRIGSGRILRGDWDYDKTEGTEVDQGSYGGYSRGSGRNNGAPGQDREEKYGGGGRYGRDYEITRGDKEQGGKERRGRFGGDRRRISETRDEEPEWFSSGPMSQHETIELRGFDDPPEKSQPQGSAAGKKKLSPSKVKRAQEWASKRRESQPSALTEEQEEDEEAGEQLDGQGGGEKGGKGDPCEEKVGEGKVDDGNQGFNFDDFLKGDAFPGLISNGIGGDGDNNTTAKSKFSAWFRRDSPEKAVPASEKRRDSLQEDPLIKRLLTEIEPVSIPGDYDSPYFAPISPAANTAQPPAKVQEMMEAMGAARKHGGDRDTKGSHMTGKILNLHELEAAIRHGSDQPSQNKPPPQPPKREEDMTAFNRLLQQMSSHSVPTNNSQMPANSMSLLELLSHSQQQDEAHARLAAAHQLLNNPLMNVAAQQQQQEMTVIKQQRQPMDMMGKFLHPGQLRGSPLQDMGQQQSRELLMRPEAQAILQGLQRGDITAQHVYQQLANPALQPRHREMLQSIIKLQAGGGPSPTRVLSPVPPHPHVYSQQQQQQQQLRVSPHPQNSYCVSPIMPTSPNTLTVPPMHQRIPSPRELQVHTQNILQRALIKKKLEEQQENYRKKQELASRGVSPNNNSGPGQQVVKSQSSPTPLAFTPTSVLRKMTADKDDMKDQPSKSIGDLKQQQGRPITSVRQPIAQIQPQTAQQWPAQFQKSLPVGRPIVKANNFQNTAEQFFAQQRLLNQQQQQQQQRKVQAGQQQQQHYQGVTGPPQQTMSSVQYNSQFSHQLRAQHQQHGRPERERQPQVGTERQGQRGEQQGYQALPPQPGGGGTHWNPFGSAQQGPIRSDRNHVGRGTGESGGDLSPTTNQLARWFSPDLLERARAGELPNASNLSQRVLSLEEIERQTAPPVHN